MKEIRIFPHLLVLAFSHIDLIQIKQPTLQQIRFSERENQICYVIKHVIITNIKSVNYI